MPGLVFAATPAYQILAPLATSRALRWADVDFTDGYLHVRQRADFYGTLGEPKSAAGDRSVPAGPFVLNTLKEWKLICPKGDLDLVFPSSDGSAADHANAVRRHSKPLCNKLKINLRWHDTESRSARPNSRSGAAWRFVPLGHRAASRFWGRG